MKNILEEEWLKFSHFQLFDDVKKRNISNIEHLIAVGKLNIEETNNDISFKRSEYDDEFNLKKHLYSYAGPKDDFDKKAISIHMQNISERFSIIEALIKSKKNADISNDNQYDQYFEQNNIEISKFIEFNSLDETYFAKLRINFDKLKRLTLNFSDLEKINDVLQNDWIEKE